jgi:hypothetical protein
MKRPDVSAQAAAAQAGRMQKTVAAESLACGVADELGVERNQCR